MALLETPPPSGGGVYKRCGPNTDPNQIHFRTRGTSMKVRRSAPRTICRVYFLFAKRDSLVSEASDNIVRYVQVRRNF